MKLICKDEDLKTGNPAVVELHDSDGVLGLRIEAHLNKETGGIEFKQIYANNQNPNLPLKQLTNPKSVV